MLKRKFCDSSTFSSRLKTSLGERGISHEKVEKQEDVGSLKMDDYFCSR